MVCEEKHKVVAKELKSDSGGSQMTMCDNCRNNCIRFSSFSIFFGKKVFETSHYEKNTRVTKTRYSMNPLPITIHICDSCFQKIVRTNRIFGIFLAAIISIATVYITVLMISDDNFSLGFYLLTFLAAVWLYNEIYFKKPDVIGEAEAKKIAKKKLEPQGYDSIFTPDEYSKLEKEKFLI